MGGLRHQPRTTTSMDRSTRVRNLAASEVPAEWRIALRCLRKAEHDSGSAIPPPKFAVGLSRLPGSGSPPVSFWAPVRGGVAPVGPVWMRP